ncbi:acetyl-CoA synthetase-like protein [Dentipellis sp. KUC8613]|nr:acetyl-CoA synthetase-like protein [Dentipellis sp. KUC8613]
MTANFRTLHGKDSATFAYPPLDGSLTIPELYEFHADHSPEHPLFVYTDENGKDVTINYRHAWVSIKRASQIVWDLSQRSQINAREDKRVIGILATADTVTYVSLFLGIMRLGFVPFLISVRNSPAAIAHLVKSEGVQDIIVSSDTSMHHLYHEATQLLAQDGTTVRMLPMVTFEDLYGPREEQAQQASDFPLRKLQLDEVALIMHSSGSTAFPKAVKMTHRAYLQWGNYVAYGEVDMCGRRISTQALPIFHALGINIVAFASCSGIVLACYRPSLPPVVPTAENLLESIVSLRCDVGLCVPLYVEIWACNHHNVSILKNLKALIYAGASLNQDTGNKLVSAGVNLMPFYGCTESGGFGVIIPEEKSALDTWEYFTCSPHIETRLLAQAGLDDIFEMVVVESSIHTLNTSNTLINGRKAFRTSDLVQRHPTLPNLWRVYGRVDDQIALSTGEKTNPSPLEAIITQDSLVQAAIMFGRMRFQNGILIQPAKGHEFDPQDHLKLEAFRNKIWPSIEKANEFAPSHSRIFKEMILVTHPSKPLEYTAKGTPRRQHSLKLYGQEINALYDAVAEASQTDLVPPSVWTADATEKFVRTVVGRVMKVPVNEEDDLFQSGCDSLQATWIRNSLSRAIRVTANVPRHLIPFNFVYTYPNIKALSQFIHQLCNTKIGYMDTEEEAREKIRIMEELVEKYSCDFPSRPPSASSSDSANSGSGEYILLTGTTGRFGSCLLAQLLARPDVSRIYALNRGPQETIRERQHRSFEEMGLEPDLLNSQKVVLLGGYAPSAHLGLQKDLYEEIRTSLTSIIMNAWRVDFNVSLRSNEPILAGVRHIIDLALSSPHPTLPHILFTSSISVVRNLPSDYLAPEHPLPNAIVALGNGYSESKWVAEQILERAARETGLPVTIVRVGQLSGDSTHGHWNVKEWVPALVRGGQILGSLPMRNERVTWLPIDVAATALLDMLHSTEPILHLVHPQPTHWESIFRRVSTRLGGLPLIRYGEWVERLRDAASKDIYATDGESDDARPNPAAVLMEFFERGEYGEDVPLATEKAVKVSKTLREAKPIDDEDVDRFMEHWKKLGFLD